MNESTEPQKEASSQKFEHKKQKIYKKFHYLPTSEMRRCLNKIISEMRGLSIDQAKHKQYVRPNEYDLFVQEMGIV